MWRELERQKNEGWVRVGVGWGKGLDEINSSERAGSNWGNSVREMNSPPLRVQMQRTIHTQEHESKGTISIHQ
jgi:hypothetical protein